MDSRVGSSFFGRKRFVWLVMVPRVFFFSPSFLFFLLFFRSPFPSPSSPQFAHQHKMYKTESLTGAQSATSMVRDRKWKIRKKREKKRKRKFHLIFFIFHFLSKNSIQELPLILELKKRSEINQLLHSSSYFSFLLIGIVLGEGFLFCSVWRNWPVSSVLENFHFIFGLLQEISLFHLQ